MDGRFPMPICTCIQIDGLYFEVRVQAAHIKFWSMFSGRHRSELVRINLILFLTAPTCLVIQEQIAKSVINKSEGGCVHANHPPTFRVMYQP